MQRVRAGIRGGTPSRLMETLARRPLLWSSISIPKLSLNPIAVASIELAGVDSSPHSSAPALEEALNQIEHRESDTSITSESVPCPAVILPSQLFDESFIPKLPLLQNILLALYCPFGVVVAVSRMMLWLGGVVLDLPIFRIPALKNIWKCLIGYRCEWKHKDRIPSERHVMVSNHISPGDLCCLFDFEPRYTHLITTGMPHQVTKTKNLPADLLFATPSVFEELSSSPNSVHLFPEGGVTNGRIGMLQFSRGFTKLLREGESVVPVVLKTRTAFNIRSHILTSSFLSNLFWMSFAPWTVATAEALPPMTILPNETRAEFAKRVQQAISDASGLAISDINITGKRKLMDQSRAKRSVNSGSSRRRPEPNCGVPGG